MRLPLPLGEGWGEGFSLSSSGSPAISPEIAAVPKAELHCHLDGILDLPMLRQLRAQGVTLPISEAELAGAYPVYDFDSFLRWFAAQQALAGNLALYTRILEAYIARLRAQGAVYAEVMVASGELPLDPAAAVDALASVRALLDVLEGGAIQLELLIAWNRARPLERAHDIATRNLRLFEAGLISGVALAGAEDGYPVAPLATVFARYRDAGVPVEIHAAEWCGPESAWDALKHGYPRRLGHGTHVFRDPWLVETLRERAIHLELCPTSNVCTGSIARLDDHPARRALDAGLSFSVSTDDPGAFRTTLAGEYAVLAERFGFTSADLRHVTANAIAARFAPELRVQAARDAVSPTA